MSNLSDKLKTLSPEQRELLLKKLQARKKSDGTKTRTGIGSRPDKKLFPVSYAQERLWFFDQLVPDSPLYNISAAVKFNGPLKPDILEKSINAVVQRHEVLQVYFKTEKGAPVQRKADTLTIPLSVEELDGSSLEQLAAQEAQTPFSLSKAPLLRARLIKTGPQTHALLLTIHHIIADGWSMGVFINETARYYRMYNGDGAKLAPLVIQYFDYAWWQKNISDGAKTQHQLDFWAEELKGMPTLLELPFDRSREAVQTFKGLHHNFNVGPKVTWALHELSRKSGVTLFITILAAFQVLIYRYSQQDDFGIGIPIANRNKKELEGLIGFFVNTLVIRAQMDGTLSFTEFLQQVKKRAFKAYDNQDVPFEQVVERVQPQRNNQVSPLFQVMFELQGDALAGLNFGDLQLEPINFETGTAKFDLLLIMEDGRDEIKGVLEYNTELFDTKNIERMMGHFVYLLNQIAEHPDIAINKIDLLPEDEKLAILTHWNQTHVTYPKVPFIHQFTGKTVKKRPNHPALVTDSEHISYAVFEKRGNQLAHLLIRQGIGRDDRIGVCMERSPEMIIALHGILKAGAAYVPFDPHHPDKRRHFMVQDSGIKMMLTQPRLTDLFKTSPIKTLVLDSSYKNLAGMSFDDPQVEIDGEQLAYMIYTSGSTGRPKGTFLSHKNILNRLLWMQDAFPLTPNDVVMQKTPFSFDVSVWEFFWPFMFGATLAVAREDGHKDTGYLCETIQKHGVTAIHFVPPMLRVFLEDRNSRRCTSLKHVICSGEALPYTLSEQFYKILPSSTLSNLYGPTEAAVDVSVYTCPKHRTDKRLPIGVPIANIQLYILDEALNPVPMGVAGELYIAGIQLARGYANRPGLTAEKFISNPYSDVAGSRMYKTGDLCRYLANGEIEYLDRIDQQVKVRGFRIELGEIEAVLRAHPLVKDCIVAVRGSDLGKEIIAWYIPEKDQVPGTDDLRQQIIRHMPEYMAPNFFIPMDVFPLTSNGKIDRRNLPEVNIKRDRPKTRFVLPRNRLESHLAELWCDVLGIKVVSMYDNFFDIGGNSLKAAVLINRLQDEVDKKLHVGMIFQAPRIAEFAMFAQEYFTEDVLKRYGKSFEIHDKVFKVMAISSKSQIKEDDIRHFRDIVLPLQKRKKHPVYKEKNKQAVFLLSPPRSGSTLLRIMLAGNPELFSPPELDLLSFNTMGERFHFFQSQGLPLWLEATTHALREIKHISTEEAERAMREIEEQDMPVKDFFRLLQEGLNQRLLVDKTPSYAIDPATLQRAEDDFDQPLYVHLVRHPYAMIYSFIEAKLDKNFFKYPHGFTRQQLAELIWLNSHQNILNFLEQIPNERHIMLRFEDLLFKPEAEVRRLTDFLGIPFSVEMLKPYQGQKMTEGLKDGSQMVGDFKFYLHQNINNKVAEKWRTFHKDDFLCDASEDMATAFGYQPRTQGTGNQETIQMKKIESVPRQAYMPLSFAQQRLWFIDQLEPGNKQYNVPGAVRIQGKIEVGLLEESLNLLIQRHEILRTSFHTVEGLGMQRIHAHHHKKLIIYDLRKLSSEQAEAHARKRVEELSKTPFKLDELPLFRTALIRLNDTESILTLVAHHIITDGWSNGIFIHELSHYYDQLTENKQIKLSPLPFQYVDIAAWQREWIKKPQAQQQLDFWKQELDSASPLLDIPTDFPRKPDTPSDGKRFYFELGSDLSDKVRSYCSRQGTTSFMLFMAAFQTLMHLYAGQEDILIGTPVAGRTQKAMEGLIGFFVNTIVLRTHFKTDSTFIEILEQVQDKAGQILKNQDFPFEKLLDALNVERNLEHAPLFQVMFSMQEDDTRAFSRNFETKPYRTDSGTAKFDLLLELYDSTSIRGAFEYNTALFRDETIIRMKGHFKRLIQSVIGQMDIPVAELVYLDPSEEHQIIKDWNNTATAHSIVKMVPQKIMEQADFTPDEPALTYQGNTFSYAVFNQQVNQWAHLLIDAGVKSEQRVAVCMERSDKLVFALHGIMRAGGAYVPLDPEHPIERTTFMLQDSAAKIILTTKAFSDKFDDKKVKVLLVDQIDFSGQPKTNPDVHFYPDQLAYMIYTSGSTGKPKGTLLSHRGLLNRLQWMQQAYPIGVGETVLQKTPFSFDVSVWEFFWSFMYGARLVVAKADGHKDAAYLATLVQHEQVTTLHFVPPMLKVFLEDHTAAECTSLKNVICSGEALPYSLSCYFYKIMPFARLHNLYGPTEATIDVSHYTCPKQREDEKLPIGRPVSNTQLYILNDHLGTVAIGVKGELHIGGIQLARGYANRPDLTAEKFIPDPFSPLPGMRLYKTGDLCRFLPTGEIEYIGRIDNQVKVRGFRIELGEIETALRARTSVEDCVVLVRPSGQQQKVIVAYIVNSETQPSQQILRNALKEELPDYMLPAIWMFIEKIPLTPNGKVDRKALPKPVDRGRSQLETEFIAPRNKREERLAALWMQILKLNKVGVRDNFFELGGDSIVGIQLISAAAREGLTFTPRELFEYPNIEGLAAIAREGVAIHAEQETLSGDIETTPILHWFNNLILPQRHFWNQSIMLKSHKLLNPEILEQVARALYVHHDMLRLHWPEQQPVIAPPENKIIFEYHDLQHLNSTDQKNTMNRIVTSAQGGHDFEYGPLFKMIYFSMDSSVGDRLFMSLHHTIIDAFSWRVLLEDLQLVYAQLLDGQTINLPSKTTSFAYWAKRLMQYAVTQDWEKEQKFWHNYLGSHSGTLTASKPGTNLQKDRVRVQCTLSMEQTAFLQHEVLDAYNTNVAENLLCALFIAWGKLNGGNSLLIDMEGHGREALFDDVDLARTIGWFTTMFPVHMKTQVSDTGDIIKTLKEQIRAIPDKGLNYGVMRYMASVGIKEAMAKLPQAGILFNYLGHFEQDAAMKSRFEMISAEADAEIGPENKCSHLLEITSSIVDGILNITFNYCPDTVDADFISHFSKETIKALQQIIEHSISEKSGGYTPSDFSEANIDQDELDDILSELDDLE